MNNGPLRLCEWAGTHVDWKLERRVQLAHTVTAWQRANRLNAAPLSFGGADGCRLQAKQFVGVVEAAGAAIEIYPKLDANLLDKTFAPENSIKPVMRNLLWMLEVAEHRNIAEADVAGLEETPDTFIDLFAFLLAKRLLRELGNGLARTYQRMEDDVRAVRGRIQIREQVTRNWNRFDRIACTWDEFTPDTPLNRLFKCACRFLHHRVRHATTVGLLADCLAQLDDVSDVPIPLALLDAQNLRWDRSTERFRLAFELARRLLQGSGHALGTGEADTFVFLLDMNVVFENYVHAVLQARFGVSVEKQKFLGTLFALPKGGINQYADYYWQKENATWIADAKYKHLAKGQNHPLRFEELSEGDFEDAPQNRSQTAGRVLNANDVRQLTVYAELENKRHLSNVQPHLMLLYPFVGKEFSPVPPAAAWNDSSFWLIPVRVDVQRELSGALPAGELISA